MLSLQKNTNTMWTIGSDTCVSAIRFNEAGVDKHNRGFHSGLYSDEG